MDRDARESKSLGCVVGAFAGAFAGAIMGLLAMIVIYNLSDRAITIGWGNSLCIGIVGGGILGALFPAVAEGAAWYFSRILP